MDHPYPLADPIPDRTIELKLKQFTMPHSRRVAAGSPATCAELDRYNVEVVLQAVYEWGGYRYTNASDAIAAVKRAAK